MLLKSQGEKWGWRVGLAGKSRGQLWKQEAEEFTHMTSCLGMRAQALHAMPRETGKEGELGTHALGELMGWLELWKIFLDSYCFLGDTESKGIN